ncbi:hypothetical protein A3D42_01310 [Candidatus Nomurabacteria bacterium RIFCSPHIGHO2_02_FULL_41_18]|uniref:Uncharacterized protein n=1 Tax=Candidatus Nomurabacteria bacterium RIFCSPHIGHO2_02_FULL_41_18 TaxID=1801754 RepID=A0A1F6W7F2_9BACT|nr:MAG: hypothetical protein A2737_00060 [Candidatus Nomurabacteria bacterium RIFCSPHIGHO2_01_FULL_41_71]OGI77833.1 MAG: hypothetical protein A3D42_01310 [Candidatus Nomurabacteria bacterium RIFCSPHIGHO2_02_FULL_41_18]OGI89983.1 MAG: hypothetical protein A3B01_01960 [Candidatus Nomurabacteria bacterium RIFCSPLOWO2_01_FULL_41_52b]OGJ00130.1 MAG: hypothetical protein A3I90_02715 [Candidatus Nomurabacteria bacterium RIFCSPLOWO2_02_FULL_41_9]
MDQGPPKPVIRVVENGIERDESPILVFVDGKNRLYKREIGEMMENGDITKNNIAMWAGENEAIIDSRAYEVLKKKCGNDIKKLKSYLKAILDFELTHSDNPERHKNRLPIEKEILVLLEEGGYFI